MREAGIRERLETQRAQTGGRCLAADGVSVGIGVLAFGQKGTVSHRPE